MTHAANPTSHKTSSNNVYSQLNAVGGAAGSSLSPALVRLHSQLKALAQCHVVLGLIILILSALADYVSSRISTLRLIGLHEVCAFYFIVTGIVGICGAASYRRGVIVAFLVMTLHITMVFVPIIVIVSSFDIHFYQHQCWGECDWPLLATSLPKNSRCQILCGESIDENRRTSMTRLGTDYRLDAGIIAAAILELFLSVVTAVMCFRGICELCGLVDRSAINHIVEITMLKKASPTKGGGENVELRPKAADMSVDQEAAAFAEKS